MRVVLRVTRRGRTRLCVWTLGATSCGSAAEPAGPSTRFFSSRLCLLCSGADTLLCMSAIKPHLAEDGESTDEELEYWECSTTVMDEQLLGRAERLLSFMPEREAAAHLQAQGVSAEDAFLALRAAQVSPAPRPFDGLDDDEEPAALCPSPKGVLDFSHAALMNMAYVRKVVTDNFRGASITPGVDAKGEVFLWTNKLSEAPPWNPAPGGLLQSNKLLSWTTKMGCPSFSLPAGSKEVGGACPGAVAGMSTVPRSTREEAAKKVRYVLQQVEPIDPAKCVCQFCYAEGGQYSTGSVQFAQVLRFLWVQQAIHVDMSGREVEDVSKTMFVRVMATAIAGADFKDKGEPSQYGERRFFRLHDSGDFFSPRYLAAWKAVTLLFPHITFWAPTRVWALGGLDDKRGWISTVNAINGDAQTSNLVIRPSAYEVNKHGPVQERLGRGWSAATTVYSPDGKTQPDAGYDWDCKAYEALKGPTCRGAEAPPEAGQKTGKIGCRTCWIHPNIRVNYTLH